MKNYKKISAAFMAAFMMTFTACSSSSNSGGMRNETSKSAMQTFASDNAGASYESYASDEAMEIPARADDATDYESNSDYNGSNANYPEKQTVLSSQKMVYTATVELETLEYDNAVNAVRNNVESFGGFVESSSESNRNKKWYYDDQVYETDRLLYITVRVPSEHFNEFLRALSGYGQVMSESTNAENISRQYADKAAEIAALEKEQERLLQMMDAADTIQDMITVEDRLTEVQSQLNRYKSSLSAMDTDVQFSKIALTVTEVHKYTPIIDEPEKEPTFLERLSERVKDSADSFLEVLEGLLFIFISLFPYLVIIAIITAIVLSVRKKRREKILAQMPKAPSAPTVPEPYGKSGSEDDKQ